MTTDSRLNSATDNDPAWMVSVAFWLTLFVAAIVYAMVALAPKFERLMLLERDHHTSRWRLVNLEKQVNELDRVASALEQDPRFAAELARSRFGAVEAGENAITLSDELQMGFTTPRAATDIELPWYFGAVRQFATNRLLRRSALVIAAALVLFGFSFLHARYAAQVRANVQRVGKAARRVGSRYLPEHADSEA